MTGGEGGKTSEQEEEVRSLEIQVEKKEEARGMG